SLRISRLTLALQYMPEGFTYSVQEVGYDFDQCDEYGTIDFNSFVDRFRVYSWREQVGKSGGGSEATLSVTNHVENTILWVSVAGTIENFEYLVGLVYAKNIKKYLLFDPEKEIGWVECYLVKESQEVEKLFKDYFEYSLDKFSGLLLRHDLFFQQKAEKYANKRVHATDA
ncbi:MAG: hypothetical protein AAF571_01570, partial [Verrucomicrobiota bacterium]